MSDIVFDLDLILETISGCATSGWTWKAGSIMPAFGEVGI